MKNQGWNFDCASQSEIETILKLGVPSSRILYANPVKSEDSLRWASSQGITRVTFDCEDELEKLENYDLLLRISTDDKGSLCALSSKFGATMEEAKKLIDLTIKKKLKLVGISFHVGSGCSKVESYEAAISNSVELFYYAKKRGLVLTVLDIGGGFPADSDKFSSIANRIAEQIQDLPFTEFIAEPGRFVVSNACTLYCKIIGEKERNGVTYFTLTEGVYTSFNNIFFDHYVPKPVPIYPTGSLPPDNPEGTPYLATFFGPTCDSMDTIVREYPLTGTKLKRGDWVYFSSMGAYSRAAAGTFNGFRAAPCSYSAIA